MEEKVYKTPEMEITDFETEDIITASSTDGSSWAPEPDEGGRY